MMNVRQHHISPDPPRSAGPLIQYVQSTCHQVRFVQSRMVALQHCMCIWTGLLGLPFDPIAEPAGPES